MPSFIKKQMTIKKPFEIIVIQSKAVFLISKRLFKVSDSKVIPSHHNVSVVAFITAIFPEKIANGQMIRTVESQPNKE